MSFPKIPFPRFPEEKTRFPEAGKLSKKPEIFLKLFITILNACCDGLIILHITGSYKIALIAFTFALLLFPFLLTLEANQFAAIERKHLTAIPHGRNNPRNNPRNDAKND